MSESSVPICQRVLERLESYYDGHSITRVEEESHFDDYKTFHEAVLHLNVNPYNYPHLVDMDDTDNWSMSGGSGTIGTLCVVFEDFNGNITLLREVGTKNKNGVAYLSDRWLPENNFRKDSCISPSEQLRMLQMRYCDGSNPLVFKFVFEEDEEDDEFKKRVCCVDDCETEAYGTYGIKNEPLCRSHHKKAKICEECNMEPLHCDCESDSESESESITIGVLDLDSAKTNISTEPIMAETPNPTCVFCKNPCECKYGHNPSPLYKKDTEGRCCNKCNQMVILARLGMMKINKEGEFEFVPIPFKPSRIGLQTTTD